MIAFWKKGKPELSDDDRRLLEVLKCCHARSAFRDNLSSVALQLAGGGSRDYGKSIIGALSTLGGLHAPIVETLTLLREPAPWIRAANIVRASKKVPGWGNSFAKGCEDPFWYPFKEALAVCHKDLLQRLSLVTQTIQSLGKNVYPNASAYTAAAAIALGVPTALAPWLFVRSRLDAWTELLQERGAATWA